LPALTILRERRRCEHERSNESERALRHIERLSNSAASPNEDIFSGKSRVSMQSRGECPRPRPTFEDVPAAAGVASAALCDTGAVIHATTILGVRHQDRTVLAGDGQVTFGNTVLKHGAHKIRRLYNESILAGFAGSAADAFALFSRFEAKLEQYRGNLDRAAVELARDWRTDRLLRRLEAMMIVADRKSMFVLSGTGDLIEPDDAIVAVGSGGPFAMAAARAMVRHSTLSAREIAEESMRIAAEICIYTNSNLTVEEL
jgi:ATP-dependent HslUV protease subunit HslV